MVFLVRYQGLNLSGGGDNTRFRFLEVGETLDVPLALDDGSRFYSVTAGAPATAWLWQGDSPGEGIVTIEYELALTPGEGGHSGDRASHDCFPDRCAGKRGRDFPL